MTNIESQKNVKEQNVHTRLSAEERRLQLIEVATALFAQKGFNGTTTKEIAAKADVNEALIFRHFNGKDALYDAVITSRICGLESDSLCQKMEKAVEKRSDKDVFANAGKIVLQRYQSDKQVFRVLLFGILEQRPRIIELLENQIRPLREYLVDYIKQRQNEGVFKCKNPQLLVMGFVGMISHYAMINELVGETAKIANDKEAINTFVQIILKSLTT